MLVTDDELLNSIPPVDDDIQNGGVDMDPLLLEALEDVQLLYYAGCMRSQPMQDWMGLTPSHYIVHGKCRVARLWLLTVDDFQVFRLGLGLGLGYSITGCFPRYNRLLHCQEHGCSCSTPGECARRRTR